MDERSMGFYNRITIEGIHDMDFTDLSDFIRAFVADEDGISKLIPSKKLSSMNFIYYRTSNSYTVEFSWDSQEKGDKIAEEIKELFGTLEGCVISYCVEYNG